MSDRTAIDAMPSFREEGEFNAGPALLIALLVVAISSALVALQTGPPDLAMTFLSTGNADCVLLRMRSGRTVLIDGGGPEPLGGRSARLTPRLFAQGVHRLDAVIITGGSRDQVGAVPALLSEVPVRGIYLPAEAAETGYGRKVCLRAAQLGVPAYPLADGQQLDLGGGAVVDLRLLRFGVGEPAVVVRVWHAGRSALLISPNGDANASGLLAVPFTPADVVRLPANGRRSANPSAFLRAVCPEVAVVCRAARASRQAEADLSSVSAELQAQGVRVFRTDLDGDVTVHLGRRRVRVTKSK